MSIAMYTSKKRGAAVFSLFFVGGCATLAGTTEVISVDSKPRGVAVAVPDAEDNFAAVTPFFVKVDRSWNHHFTLTGLNRPVEKTVDCRFRWLPVLGGNLPLGLLALTSSGILGLMPYAIALSIDLISGAAWGCDSRVVLVDPEIVSVKQREKEPCDRLLTVLVDVDNPAIAWEYERAWSEFRGKNPNHCEIIVEHDAADGVLSRREVSQLSLRKMSRAH